MRQEDKELLLQDLCGRLPYGVMIHLDDFPDAILMGINNGVAMLDDATHDPIHNVPWDIEYIKPYLFPLSSMTEEQKKFFKDRPIFLDSENELVVKEDFFGNSRFTMLEDWVEVILWLNKNHFDYRGLIKKGLAIDCTNLNIY